MPMQMEMEMETTNERTTNERCAQKNCQTFIQFNGFCCINPTGNICYAIAIYRTKWRRLLTMRVSSTFPKWKMENGVGDWNCAKGVKDLWLARPFQPQTEPQQQHLLPTLVCAVLCCQSVTQSGILAKESWRTIIDTNNNDNSSSSNGGSNNSSKQSV